MDAAPTFELRRRVGTEATADIIPATSLPGAIDSAQPPRRFFDRGTEEDEAEADAVRDHLLGMSPPGSWADISNTHPLWPDAAEEPRSSSPPKPENTPLPSSPAPSRPASPASASVTAEDDDEPLCRICFLDASASIEDPSLGRLIQPCLCRGTQARVHIGCLQRWRRTSASRTSFWKCDQCGFRYHLRRTKVAGLAENRLALGGVTVVVFLLLVTLAGYIAGWLVEASVIKGAYDEDIGGSAPTFATSSWGDLWGYSFGIGYGGIYYDNTGRLMGDALGEAVRVLNKQLNVDLDPASQPTAPNDDIVLERIADSSKDGTSYRYRRVTAAESHPGTRSRSQSSSAQRTRSERLQGSLPPWVWSRLQGIIEHQIMGLAFVGILSFFQLLISVTFFSPLNYGLRNTIFRMIRGNRRDGEGAGLGSSMIVFVVIMGLLKAFYAVWKGVGALSRWILSRLEDSVLDVR